jgi:hypothetical protein
MNLTKKKTPSRPSNWSIKIAQKQFSGLSPVVRVFDFQRNHLSKRHENDDTEFGGRSFW